MLDWWQLCLVPFKLLDDFLVFCSVKFNLIVKVGFVLIDRFQLFFQLLQLSFELNIFYQQRMLNQRSHQFLSDFVGLRQSRLHSLDFTRYFWVYQLHRTAWPLWHFTLSLLWVYRTFIRIVTEKIHFGLSALVSFFFHVEPFSLLQNLITFQQFQCFIFLINHFVQIFQCKYFLFSQVQYLAHNFILEISQIFFCYLLVVHWNRYLTQHLGNSWCIHWINSVVFNCLFRL